jgi:hypothetical protein
VVKGSRAILAWISEHPPSAGVSSASAA